MLRKVLLYSVAVLAIGLAWAIATADRPITSANLVKVLLLTPVFGFVLWLRWDWAPERRRKRNLD